jgi:UDP-N-acetylmuramate--alanine ligase
MKYRHIHFVGIKGVGMTALAVAAKEAGVLVTGSDIADDFITKNALQKVGIVPFAGFAKDHIEGADLLITTGAHGGYDNPEVVAAKEKGIAVMSHGEALGAFLSGDLFGKKLVGIAVAGTHGKTTTTALIATIFMENGYDPSYIIGTGSIPTLKEPGHFGKGKYFIVEADEYATEPKYDKNARFLWLHPEIAVMTNIEHDHPDIYPSIDDVRMAFTKFANTISDGGVLIGCGDDKETVGVMRHYQGRKISYGFSPANDYVIQRMTSSKEHTFFSLTSQGMDLGQFTLRIFGEHNVQNAVAAIVVALESGLTVDKIKQSLARFTGSMRRFEYIGTLPGGATLYDDYAHHPTEIKKTLKAAKLRFPNKAIVVVFQPHTYSRTKELFSDFSRSFADASQVLLTDIFASLREDPDESVSSAKLALLMKQHNIKVEHLPRLSDVVEYLKKSDLDDSVVIITMGAGDVYTIRDSLSILKRDG